MAAGCLTGDAVFVASQHFPGEVDEVRALVRAVGALYVAGQDIAPAVARGVPVDLPGYAFQRERYWIDAARPAVRDRSRGEDALWQAVADGAADRVTELLGAPDGTAVAALLPHLAAWRARQERADALAGRCYTETWEPAGPPPAAPRGHWLIVAPPAARELADQLAGLLTGAGASAHLVPAGDRAEGAALIAGHGSDLAGVLALTALDLAAHPDHPAVTMGAARSLALVQALSDAKVRAPLWFLTRGAVAAAAPDPGQALVWGLGHVVALEHPERWGGLIDLPDTLDARCAGLVLATLAAHGTPDAEEHAAVRPDGRLVRRLRRAPVAGPAGPWTPRGTVLITGGSGALAAQLARRLAERGAEHLVLASRQGPAADGAGALAAALEAAGARVSVVACDVTDRRQLAGLLDTLDRDPVPLRAVVHTAGVLDDRLLDRMDTAALAAVAAPKLTAATHLHELTRDRDLDAFVLYTSIVGVLGNVGQANYAAANAAVDALAARRRAEGLPAVAVAWGPWADGGMTHGAAEAQLRRIGLEPMPAEQALDALDGALAGGGTVVAGIDWPTAARSYAEGRNRPLLREIPEAAVRLDATDEPGAPLRATLLELDEPARAEHVRGLLAGEAAAVLGIADPATLDPRRGFKDLGFDSMMAVDFSVRVHRRTGVATPKTLVFDHPDLTAATRWLLGELAPRPEPVEPNGSVSRAAGEPLAVIGVGLRMPGDANDLDDLWTVLAEGRDTVGPVPPGRFSRTEPEIGPGSFLADVAHFDAAFFGISPREAEPMDPQHRLLLETAWNCLEDAGIRPDELRDSRTGVFVGAGAGEYSTHRQGRPADTYTLTGSLPSFNAGRLAYHLGLQGPALAVDTACSSSLVALHLAAEALRNGECELALAGGVQVLADPAAFVALGRSNALAPDGRSKTFSANADGYGRGEGVGVLAMTRLSDAVRAGRRILGVIRGSAVNHDGASSGITAPNGSAQRKVIRAALDSAGLGPADIDYVECHGTGTRLGDPIEVQALAAVYGTGRAPGRELGLGTAKSVIGHLESAAGIAGVCKMLAALRNDTLPATLHSNPRNPHIPWDDLPVRVVDTPQPWPRIDSRPRRAGVSSFGLSGTNAHVIVEEAPADPAGPTPVAGFLPVVVSGRDEATVREQAGRWADWLAAHPEAQLSDVAATAAGRTHFDSRACVIASSTDELVAGLRAFAESQAHDTLVSGSAQRRGRVVFVFPGQGSQWAGMGRDLLAANEVFAEAIDACDAALRPWTGWSVREVLAGAAGSAGLDRVDVVQPALFAMAIGLSAVWRSLGVEPAAVVGHSQGEVPAAVISGALSLEQGAQIVAQRSQAVLTVAGQGGMALIERPAAQVEEFLAPYGDALSVAAVNTPGSTVISGAVEAIERIVAELQAQGVYARTIKVDYASHNAQMDPLLPDLATAFADLTPGRAEIPLYSTVTGQPIKGPVLDGDYWCRNLREPVRFDRALEQLLTDGHSVFVEISAHPVLAMPLTDASAENSDAEHGGVVVGSLARDRGDQAQLLRNLGLLHVHGVELDWARILGVRGLVALPTYAFQRERFWTEPAKPAGDAAALGLDAARHPWIGAVTPLAGADGHLVTGRLSLAEQPWLADHTVFGSVLVPGTGLLELAIAAAHEIGAPGVAELTLAEPLVLEDAVRIQITVSAPNPDGRREIAIHSRPDRGGAWTRHAGGMLAGAGADGPDGFAELSAWPVPDAEPVPLDGVYQRFDAQGIDYGPAFRGLTELWRRENTAYGRVRLPEAAAGDHRLHPALLDAALHAIIGVSDVDEPGALLPFEWRDVELHATGAQELRILIEVEPAESGRRIRAWGTDAAGAPVVRIGGLDLRRATAAQLRGADGLHRLEFRPVPAPDTRNETERVVVDLTGAVADPAAPDAARRAAEQALGRLKELLSDDRSEAEELVVVTRGSIAAGPGDRLDGLPNAPVWGLVRSARAEHPERALRLIDLGPDDVDRAALDRALAVTGEPELAVRGGEVLAARLVQAGAPAGDARALNPGGTVLITGGTGELGRAVARHLVVRHGIRRLVLTSRRGPDTPGAAELVRELEKAGAAAVRVVACDVTRRADLARVLTLAEPDHPWTAVLHLAGVLDDGVLLGLDPERLSRLLDPKVAGAVHLDALTRDLDLAAFVLFSSAAGTVGTAGQGGYGAANTYLDAFAARCRAQGRPVTSLAWGLWEQAGVGMTAHLGAVELDRMRRQGIAPLPVAQGLALLDAALARPAGNFVPVRLDPGADGPLFRALARRTEPAAPKAAAKGQRDRIRSAPAAERPELVNRLVLQEVAAVLGLGAAHTLAPDQVLQQLGLDSLMAVELRRALASATGLTLPATLAFDHPTPEAIAALILARLDPPAEPTESVEPEDWVDDERSVDEINAELNALLEASGLDLV
ncbi:MAG TPA: SDR family NAD(P)-dependent oxidoreductase [Actinophytocola sp.]|nr:SDR family NAD(P)-dependent oxidoreductase [Actinophytocola sp.]HEU5472314.1 SDR family NAD(P)-dependent oxidoreductase [Actinophytocola sp.]